jgi:cyclic nucleotide-binding protein
MLTMVERVMILKGADMLHDVGPRHLLKLAEVAREVELWEGDTIYEEHDLSDALYMVVEGRVRLTIGGQTTTEVGPGEAFGTWALVDDSDRGHRVVCLEDGLALALHRDDFYDVAAGDLVLLQQVLRALAKRLRALVTDRPQEARLEGEGFEKTEAMEENEGGPAARVEAEAAAPSPPALGAGAPAGQSLAAAALGQPSTEGREPVVAEPGGVTEGIATPEPIEPVEPPSP